MRQRDDMAFVPRDLRKFASRAGVIWSHADLKLWLRQRKNRKRQRETLGPEEIDIADDIDRQSAAAFVHQQFITTRAVSAGRRRSVGPY